MKTNIALIVLILLCGVALAGCGYQDKARTSFGAGPFTGWYFDDSKDNDIEVAKAVWGDKSIEGVKIRNNASDVNVTIANIALANAEVAKQHGENIANALKAIAEIASRIPGANPIPTELPPTTTAPSGE